MEKTALQKYLSNLQTPDSWYYLIDHPDTYEICYLHRDHPLVSTCVVHQTPLTKIKAIVDELKLKSKYEKQVDEIQDLTRRLSHDAARALLVSMDLDQGLWFEISNQDHSKTISIMIPQAFNHAMACEVINSAIQDLKKGAIEDE